MTPQEVILKVKKLGIARDKKTLRRYADMELVPMPVVKNYGRGTGRVADYPDSTPYEFYSSLYLKQLGGYNFEEIKEARKLAKCFERELQDDDSLLEWAKELIAKNGPMKFSFGEGVFSNELRLALKKSLTEKTADKNIIALSLAWWYLSREEEGKAKEVFKDLVQEAKM